ncbi:mitochondrial division protein-like protein 1 [Sporormia fimetaria CBS 119925]|uniref:Mitochondrial division protein 1 n=1 Tax=Sporormia fimetaria CBS 119925 TaxID=1340428 RepID=A0A6A6VMW3_9PLEO|nr:mitochondrial division protein-like protein 1 [Sporormia fimetaria CBS 119925]
MTSERSGSPVRRGRSTSPRPLSPPGDDASIIDSLGDSRKLQALGRKVTATAGSLINAEGVSQHYHHALGELHKELRRPGLQRSVFSFAQTTPRDLVRSRISVPEIQHRALASLPDELLHNIPEDNNQYSLFQGFQASLPEEPEQSQGHRKRGKRGQKLLGGLDDDEDPNAPPSMAKLKSKKHSLSHRLEMMGVRKHMCATEIHEIDNKIANLNTMRKIVLDRLAGLEMEEADIEVDLLEVGNKIEDLQEELDDAAALAPKSPESPELTQEEEKEETDGFMSESIYQKIPSPKNKRRRAMRRISMPILHEHLEPGSKIKEIEAHTDVVTALDFDSPWGTLVTASLDDTVRVWDLSAGRCIGLLEGHLSSVRCLQVEDNIVATGSMDASIRLWDLSKAEYAPLDNRINKSSEEDDGLAFENSADPPPPPPPTIMQDCPLFSLESHVDEVTALHFKGNTLVSGSSDKTLRQWDLVKGRCVQTLDVLWAAAQATATMNTNPADPWKQTGRVTDTSADFVGALQVFDAALACGTADCMVRLWDLRSGQVHRSLVGHTGPVTALQFDDVHLVTGSLDRSIRIWDLRTGSIFDAYAYDHPVTSMMFDARRIVTAAGEDVVKVYDKTDGRHWNCGPGADEEDTPLSSTIERVRIKEGYMVEGRKNGVIGVWSC